MAKSDRERRINLEKRGIDTQGLKKWQIRQGGQLIKQQKQDRYLESRGMLDYQQPGYRPSQQYLPPQQSTQPSGTQPVGYTDTLIDRGKSYYSPGYQYALDTNSGLLVREKHETVWLNGNPAERAAQETQWYQNINAPKIATVQDALNGQANWSDVEVSQRQQVLSDPKFYQTGQINKYPAWMQQQILADPAFKWDKLPKWQKLYYEFSSSPATMGAAQGALSGAIGGPVGGVVGGAVGGALGWAAAKSGYDPAKEAWEQPTPVAGAFGWLNWLAEQAEKTVGIGLQTIGAAQDPNTTLKDVFTREGWDAGSVTFETLAPALQKATEGDKRFTALDLLPVINTVVQLGDMVLNPEKYKGAEQILGSDVPAELEQTFQERIAAARERIKQGENYREVMLDFQVGVLGQLGDMVGQSAADPLNVMPRAETRIGSAISDLTGNKVAGEAFRQSSAPLEAASRYRTLVQTGQAKVIDPAFRVDQMGAVSRFLAGISDEGKVRAGPFSRQGILDKPSKTGWIEQMTSLTPESRAQIGAGMFYENLGALLTHFEDPHDAAKYLRALASNDMETWAQLGSQFADSPEFYTVLPALESFNGSQLENVVAGWDASEPNRTALLRIADVLGEEPAKLIDDLAARGTKEQDFNRILDRLRQSSSPQAKVILDEVANQRFTADTLAQIVDVFSGDNALAWHTGQWKAQMLDALGKHFDDWAVKNFDLKPDSGFFRFAHMMKSAQSVLLLGGSPGYALTNAMSNMVHRAATGIYGYLTPTQINSWMDRFGVKPARLDEGFGMSGAVEQVSAETAVQTEAMRNAKRGEGALRQAHDVINQIGRKMPFNRLSAWFEKLESKQGFAIAMRQFWSQSWRRGVGFSKMTPELAQAVQGSGINPEHIYAAIESGMGQAEIERAIFGRQEAIQARSLVHDAAQKIGIASSEAATMLEKIGILDALDGYLRGADSRDKLTKAFERAARRAQDEIDIAASRDAIARAEHISQRVGIEGAKALTDIITDVEMQGIEKWLEHYERMGEAAAALDSVDPATRSNLWEIKYNESNQEFRRYNAQRGSTYLGILKAVGLENNQHARDWLTTLADIDKTMDNAYHFMRDQRNKHFQKWQDNWDDPRQYDERTRTEAKIDREFKRAMKQEDVNLSKMGELLGRQYEQLFGDVAGEAARQSWETIVAFRKEMVNRQQKFRDMQRQAREQGVPLADRQAAAKEFWQNNYKFMIVEMARLKQDTIAHLDRIARGGGSAPIDRTPTDPTVPPGQTPDEIAALRQAAEERRQAQRAAVNAVWDIAEQYSKMQPGDSSNYSRGNFNDKFILLGALKKEEYGGDPSITNLDDAIQKLTPEQVTQIFETRKRIKEQTLEAENAARDARFQEARQKATDKAGKVKKMENVKLLQAIRSAGGVDWAAVPDITGERNAKGWPPGVFSKTGKNRWALDQMAVILATEWDFPIKLDDPADPGGVNQLVSLMQRARAGEDIYPITHDYEAEIAAAEAENITRLEMEAEEAEAINVDTWESDAQRAITDGDLIQLAELMGTIPEGARPDGESYGDWIARQWDEVDQRTQQEAQDLAIAENMTRAQLAVEDVQRAADVAMTRQLLFEKYQDAFPNVSQAEISSWMEVSDAALETIGRLTGQSMEEMYGYYRDVLRGELSDIDLFQESLAQPSKGGLEFLDGQAIIHAFDGGDISTVVHENAHIFLQMMRDGSRRTGNLKLLDDLGTFDDWARLEQSGEVWNAPNSKGQHSIKKYGDTYVYRGPSGAREFTSFDDARFVLEQEMFARAFERYMAEGKAPTPKLKRVFEQFKQWLVNIYKAVSGSVIDVNLTDDMRGVFNRLLGEQEAIDKVLGRGDQRRPAYEALRQVWDTLDEAQQSEAINMILQRTMVDPLSGLETLVAKDISGGEKPDGWFEAESDLNALTAINNTWGHGAGDQLIKMIGGIAKVEVAKVGGRAFRVGGDEFSYWFPDRTAAIAAMDAIDLAVQNEVVNVGGEDRTGFTISYGIGETLKDADASLYKDKARRVELGHRPTVRDQMPPSVRVRSTTPTETTVPTGATTPPPAEIETTPPPVETKTGPIPFAETGTAEAAFNDANGAISYKYVNRLVQAGYRFEYGKMDLDTWADVSGVVSAKIANRLEEAGLTVRKIDEAAAPPETAIIEETGILPPEQAVPAATAENVGVIIPPEAASLATGPTPPAEAVPAGISEAPPQPAITPEIPPETAILPAEQQLGMFQTEDLPLFSQTPQPATDEVFTPRPEIRQESFIESRPEFGQRLEENLVKVKQGLTEQDLAPTEPTVSAASRERTLLDALVDKLSRSEWFPKSRDFETYIKNLGFDIEKETDLNLAYDLMEGAYNMRARTIRADLDSRNAPLAERLAAMDELESNLTEARRTLGKMKLQQFSTPLTISEAAGWAADVKPGDIVGEPTAGTANLVDRFHDTPNVTVKVNEIDPGRQEVLRQIGYEPTGMNLMGADWVIENGKKAGAWSTVQISNPPWGSYSTGKYGKATHVPVKLNDWSQRFTYLELQRLADDGRFVGVMPANWLYSMDRKTRGTTKKPSEFYKWLQKNYSVRAVIESPPGAYKQRATDISSLLVVIDKTPHLLDDVGTIERYADAQPKTWDEYAALVDSVPKRTEGAISNAQQQTKPITAGPDAGGIVDPAARRGDARADIEAIGRPAKVPGKRTDGGGRATEPGESVDAGQPIQRDPGDVEGTPAEGGDTTTSVVAEQPAGIPDTDEGFAYSPAFQERLIAGRAAVKDSRSFTEYVGRAPLEQSDVIHPHPNTVVETKGLAGVPYPPLEEAYRPSPAVMRAMKNRVLSYDGNLDPVWAAIQQNDKHNMGMLVADDVGMGKSRTAAAFVIDRIEKGKKKILVVTKDQQNVLNLMNQEFPQVYSGKADENGAFLGDPPQDFPAKRIFLSGETFPKVKKNEEAIPTFTEPTVYFVTSSEFMHFTEQLNALGPDVVVVDEAHLFKNVGNTARGVAWTELHKNWISRDVNTLYLTATPGVDLAELQYLYGLKVWAMDGFGDWIKVITGQESPEKLKAKQAAAAQVDDWVKKVEQARESIDTDWVTISRRNGEEVEGIRVGEVSVYKTTEKWNNGRYAYEYKGKENTFQATNEMEAILVADMVNKKIATMPADMELSYGDINNMFYDASSTFVETYKPPGREVIKSLGQVGITEASDILKQKDKGKWGKKGLGAFETTLPPAHTEQIMRELKVTGSYMARDISRAGVEFGVKEYVPPAKAKASFNKRVSIYRRLYDAWARYGAMNEGPKKTAGMFGVNGDIQADAKRALFNMRLPGVIEEADAAIARGEQAVISVVSVSEVDGETGSLVSAIDKINTKKVEKVGKDEYSDPEEIPEALLDVLTLKEDLKELESLPSPIDVLRDRYGDRIAFVTGATSTKDRIQAQRDFQNNKLDVIVISGAGKTGINLHDVTGKRKAHLIVGDYEWSATNFKQELGRVDRTGQRSSPKVTVMHTGSAAERKFVATISNRMKGLGATSKGGSESTGTGAMTESFELGNTIDKIALNAAWQDFPQEWKGMFLDKYFRDPNVPGVARSTLDTTSEALSKFLLGLQSMDIETANEIMNAYIEKRTTVLESGTDADDSAARSTAANTGEILRQVDLGDNLRISEVRNAEGQKFAVLDGVLTPHMNTVKNVVTAGRDIAERFLQGGNAWMRWVQFYDEGKNQYVTGLRVNPGKVKDLVEHFGQKLGSMHRPETALVDLRAGDRIKIVGANSSEWELYFGKAGARVDKIVIDNARLKDREALMKNGAAFNAVGNFFYVPQENLDQFFKRFPINNEDAPQPPTLYQSAPITPDAHPEMPLGGFEQASSFLPESEVRDDGWSQHVRPLIDAMRDTAIDRLNTKPLDGATRDMSPEGQAMLRKYVAKVQGEMATTKLATMRWGENQRDSAMFNYQRRYGFDKYLEVPYPYEFFYTRAMFKWLGMGLDGPAWLSNYARMQKQQNRYERDIPERLRKKIKIPAPWMPDWMGDSLYIDPIGGLFPPANFLRPFERMAQDKQYQLVEAERIIQEWAADGSVSDAQLAEAAQTRSGPVWERALAEAKMRRESEISNPMDFFSTTFGPAWWMSAPLNAAGIKVPGISKGDPNKVSNLPLTNTARGLQAVTKGTWAEPAGELIGLLGKPEEWVRKQLKLPKLGEYGEYYTKRQVANMVAEGLIDSEQAQLAMIEQTGPIWEQAGERVQLELAMRVPTLGAIYAGTHEGPKGLAQAALPSLFGSGLLPAGELEYRGLKQEWNEAWKRADSGDAQAINQFFDDHPEYEAYLAKGKDGEEQLRSFLVGQIWDGYMELGPTNRKQATAEMGEYFQQAFLDKETRSYESVDVDTLTQWAQMLRQQVPQAVEGQPVQVPAAPQLNMYDPNVTAITDEFFQQRTKYHNDYYQLEQGYYNLPKSKRAGYLLKNPQLKEYWQWKDQWFDNYPELEPIFRGQVFKRMDTSSWPPGLIDYVNQYAYTGKRLPKGAAKALEQQWIIQGRPYDNMQTWLNSQVVPAMLYGEQQ